jgi:hypothetical protein
MNRLFANDARASAIRSLLRALLIVLTAFGLRLTPEQIGAIQLLMEAVLQVGRAWHTKGG